jgi:tetratricopeptide (TPR) repeat protein
LRATADQLRSEADGWVNVQAKADASVEIAIVYLNLGDIDHALVAIERAIDTYPDEPWYFTVRALIRRGLPDAEGAEADCEAAARIDRDTPLEFLLRGHAQAALCNDHGSALADFDRVIALAPNWHFGYFWRGVVHEWLRHYDRALVDINRAIELAPHFPSAYVLRAGLYQNQGRLMETFAEYEKAIELDQYNSVGWDNHGYSLFRQGRFEEALTALDKALELNPQYADAHADRGHMLAYLGRCDEAAEDARKAEEKAHDPWPSRGIAQMHLSFFYYSCPDHYDLSAALRHAQTVYDAVPDMAAVQEIQALALLRNGDYTEAKRIYLEMFAENPDRTAWFPLAMSLWQLDEKAEARSFYDRSVTWMDARLPDNPVYAGMQREAAELLGIQSPGR